MRILYVTQWFEPEPAFKGLSFVQALLERGFDVEVATGFPNYPGGKLYPGHKIRPWSRQMIEGVRVFRLFLMPSHDSSAIGRVLNYLSFFLSVLLFGLFRGWRYDAVYVYHPPITPALATALFTRIWRRPFAVEIQDLWPDSAMASGMMPVRYASTLEYCCHFVYRKATRVVAQSRAMASRLQERGVPDEKLSVIYNWSNYRPAIPGHEAQRVLPKDGIHCVYGGNLGQAQSLATVIEAASIANARMPSFRLHLFGDGIEREKLARIVEHYSPGVVTMYGAVPKPQMDRIFDESDMLVLHLNDDPLYEIAVPSKLQHYLSCGKPIVGGFKGEAASILGNANAGLVSTPLDASAMAENMVIIATMSSAERAETGRQGREYYNRNCSFKNALDETEALLRSMVATGKP
jgi:colanic acid biosynthesis glycosyl transferase WcaI